MGDLVVQVQDLVVQVREWITLDEEMNSVRQQLRAMAARKKDITDRLLLLMKDRNLDQIDVNEGKKIIRQQKTQTSAVSKKHLIGCLEQYYKDTDKAVEISRFILSARKEKKTETIIKR
jgi:hypothetical protein